MLDNKKSEENIRHYLNEGMIAKVKEIDKNVLNTLVKNSDESLETADFLSANNKSLLWVIVCSYYSMYYIANAVLYKNGYKVGRKISHTITYHALVVFVKNKLEKKLLEDYAEAREEAEEIARTETQTLIKSFEDEKEKRSTLQYEMTETIKHSKAETSLKRAKHFTDALSKLL